MITLLHTADWHLGKQLLKEDLSEEMAMFFSWLFEQIKLHTPDALLVSGDVFDMANPSRQAMQQYYDFLKQFLEIAPHCKLIITAGNHDSPAVLDGPAELLKWLNIKITGTAPQTPESLFTTVEKENEKLVIASVPFLRERDIRLATDGETYEDKVRRSREGIERYYSTVNAYYESHFEKTPFVVMGHLYVQNGMLSDSERDIQVGNQAAVSHRIFGTAPNYVALGHLHRPQNPAPGIHYSGSPICFSFSEKEDKKQINLVRFLNGTPMVEALPIPSFRKLVTFKGTLAEITTKLNEYTSTSPLTDIAEVMVREEKHSYVLIQQLQDLCRQNFNQVRIAKYSIQFNEAEQGTASILSHGDEIGNYSPKEIFKRRLALEENKEGHEDLVAAFDLLLENLLLQPDDLSEPESPEEQ